MALTNPTHNVTLQRLAHFRDKLKEEQLACNLKLNLVKNDTDQTQVSGVIVTVKTKTTHAIYSTHNYNGAPIFITLPAGFDFTICCSGIEGASSPLSKNFTATPGDAELTMKYTIDGAVYGFHIDSTNADPKACVSYLEDAVGATPAKMDYTNNYFDYGSWDEAFFMPRPCMVKYDGTLDYYLDPNDYSKKADGSPSDYDNINYGGNVMVEFGRNGRKIYYKIVPDATDDTSASIYISDFKKDSDYKSWPFLDMNGDEIDHFYVAAYNGSYDSDNKMRSISGQAIGCAQIGNTELTRAKANNVDASKIEWSTENFGDIQLINFLLILMGKDLNSQRCFGNGYVSGGAAVTDLLDTGTLDKKGLFWGAEGSVARTGVKVFGIEHWWGNQWRRYEGHITDASTQHKYKLTYSQADGSTADGYSSDGAGYIETSLVVPGWNGGAYIKKQKFSNAMLASEVGASTTTYYCDASWANVNCYAFHGGPCNNFGATTGAFAVLLNFGVSRASSFFGAALSLKPLA